MKKKVLASLLVAAGAVFSMSAEVLSPYTETFENSSARPRGWLRVTPSSYAAGTFTVNETGGHSGGYVSVNQYSNYWSTYYNNYNYFDVLVTPPVTGDVSIWVRKNGTDPCLTFYDVTSNPSSMTTSTALLNGTTKNLVEGVTIDNWTQITVPNVPANTYIAIRAHNLDIDDFTAASANVTYKASIIAAVKNTTGSTNLEADADNNVTIKFNVSLENNGDIEFPATAGGFKIELSNRNLSKVVGTGSIDDAIPFGTTVSKDFSMSFPAELAPDTKSNSFYVTISNDRTGSVEASLAYFTIIPYAPVATFMFGEDNDKNQSSYNDVNILEDITVGIGPAGTSRTLYLWNSGTAPMTVKSTIVDGDFTADANGFILAKNEKKAITITTKGNPGYKAGSVTFNIDGYDAKTYGLQAQVTAADSYYQNFEAENLPAGYIVGNYWKLTDTPAALKTLGGDKHLYYSSTSSTEKFIMPKLTFSANDTLSFMATKTDNTSSTLKVYTSPDRVTWTEVLAIDTRNEDTALKFNSDKPTGSGYGTYEYKIFNAPMPEGDVYVAFEAGGARVDNISGGKLTPVTHDIYVTKVSLPDASYVNTRYITNITLQNILEQAEEDYAIVLEVDGKEVARAEESPALLTNESHSFDIRYTPHETGTFDAALIFVTGDYRLPLKEFELVVDAERAEAEYQVGNYKITTSDPFNTFYAGSQCQILYRSEDLGMQKGMKVIGFTFNGYCTDVVKKHIKVWAQNTAVNSYDFSNIEAADPADMTLVYDGDYTFNVAGDNSNKVYEPVLTINFSNPLEYNGENMRFMFDIRDVEGGTTDKHVFFTVDNSAYDYWNDKYDDRAITRKVDFAEDLDENPAWAGYRAGFPVTYFKVAKDVVVVRGSLSNDFDKPVAGALIKFVSDDILYSTTSSTEGSFSMNVGNLDHTYKLTVSADGYNDILLDNITLDAKTDPEVVYNFNMTFTDRNATLSGKIINTYDDYAPLAGATVTLSKNDLKAEGTTDTNGEYSVTVPDFVGEYTVTVIKNGETLYTDKYTFTDKTGTLDLRLGYEESGIKSVNSDPAAWKISVNGNDILVVAPSGSTVSLYTASGIFCGSMVSNGGTVEFNSVAPNIYIIGGHKVVVK